MRTHHELTPAAIGLGIVLATALLLVLGWASQSVSPFVGMKQPRETLQRVVTPTLDWHDATAVEGGLGQVATWAGQFGFDLPAVSEALDALYRLEANPETRLEWLILLGEIGDTERLRSALDDPNQDADPRHTWLRMAYLGDEFDPEGGELPDPSWVAALESPWFRDRLMLRLAAERGDTETREEVELRASDRQDQLEHRMQPWLWAWAAQVGLGFLIALYGFSRRPQAKPLANGLQRPPWTLRQGFGATAWGMVLFIGGSFGVGALVSGVSLLKPISMALIWMIVLIWMRISLLDPHGLDLRKSFGLRLSSGAAFRLWPTALRYFAVAGLVNALLIWGTSQLGLSIRLTEGLSEDLIRGSDFERLSFLATAVLWAPLFEEIFFRGFLFTTLRRSWPFLPAALLSSLAFGLVHFYSLTGFLIVSGLGFVFAWSYERSRSLWPAILVHAAHNAFITLASLSFYNAV